MSGFEFLLLLKMIKFMFYLEDYTKGLTLHLTLVGLHDPIQIYTWHDDLALSLLCQKHWHLNL